MSGRVMIMAGGTGGHVFPALAVAAALRERNAEVVWMGTHRGLEARIVPAHDISIEWVSVSGLRGHGAVALLVAPFRLCRALWQALRALWRCRPGVVLGMGGFVSGPGGVAAWLMRKPLVVHEQNAIPGLTNRILTRFATQVLEAFPGSFRQRAHAECVGNPVRAAIADLVPPPQRFAGRGQPRLLVLGGSQGARALNVAVPAAIALLPDSLRPQVWHQAGEKTLDEACAAYAETGLDARVDAFIDDMAAAYAWADLVVCRAGAITVAELAAAGLGSVLIPFPFAVDDHQTRNAEFLVAAGAGVLVPEAEATARRLASELSVLLADRERLLALATAARALAKADAAAVVAERCLALMQARMRA